MNFKKANPYKASPRQGVRFSSSADSIGRVES